MCSRVLTKQDLDSGRVLSEQDIDSSGVLSEQGLDTSNSDCKDNRQVVVVSVVDGTGKICSVFRICQ